MNRRDVIRSAALAALTLPATGCVAAPIEQTRPAEDVAASDRSLFHRAFLYGYGLYEFARARALSVQRGRPVNAIAHQSTLSDHTHRTVTARNIDTLYSSAFLELSGGPVEVRLPDALQRYHSIAFMNAFTDNFEILGTRRTGGKALTAWLVGPKWQGDAPADVRLVRSETNDVWLLGRVLIAGNDDFDEARRIQTQIKVAPVPGRGPVRAFQNRPVPVPDARQFLQTVNEMLSRSPSDVGQAQRATAFQSVGLSSDPEFTFESLSPGIRDEWTRRFPDMLATLRHNEKTLLERPGGWTAAPRDLGNYGTNDELRAAIALSGLAALPAEEAIYFRARIDADGAALSGQRAYMFKIPADGVPAGAFWSLTMYAEEPDGRMFLIDNPIRRYAINDRTPGMIKNEDGSMEILIQHQVPATDGVNWLPSPAGPFVVALRAYLPHASVLDGDWNPRPLQATFVR